MNLQKQNKDAKQEVTLKKARSRFRKWTGEDEAKLLQMLISKSYVQIGIELGRTYHGIKRRVHELRFRGVLKEKKRICSLWQPTEVREVGPLTVGAMEQRVANYNEKYKRACEERDGYREKMLTAQEQERRVRKQVAEMEADYREYKAAGRKIEIERDKLAIENKGLLGDLENFRHWNEKGNYRIAELSKSNDNLKSAARVFEEKLVESQNCNLELRTTVAELQKQHAEQVRSLSVRNKDLDALCLSHVKRSEELEAENKDQYDLLAELNAEANKLHEDRMRLRGDVETQTRRLRVFLIYSVIVTACWAVTSVALWTR